MHADLSAFTWTSQQELNEAVVRHSGMGASDSVETEPMHLDGRRLVEQFRDAAPFIVRIRGEFLGVVECRRAQAVVLAPDLALRRVSLDVLRDELCRDVEAPFVAEVDRILEDCAVPASRRSRARAALLRERLGARPVGMAWQLRVRPGTSFVRQLRSAGVIGRLAMLAAAHVAEYALWLVSWWMIGTAALSGRVDWGWLLAWVLAIATIVPLRAFANWSQSVAGIGLGGLLKQRLLAGALELSPEHIRRKGAGQLLGCAIEAETMESLALSGGLNAAVAGLEVVLAGVVLALGAGGPLHALMLAAWVAVGGVLAWRYANRRAAWTGRRLEMTHDLVERMSGYRTRLAQSPPGRWHDGEDQALDAYLTSSAAMDARSALLSAVVPRGWLIVGLCGLAPAFLTAGLAAAPQLAVGLGGTLLAYQALRRLMGGASQLSDVAIAWRQVAPMFRAAGAAPSESIPPSMPSATDGPRTVLEAHDLTFRYPDRAQPALSGASLRIEKGDWLLLEGSSGGGKSTLTSLLAGLRKPDSGLLLSGGLDRPTLGPAGWRQRVAAAPQYHENHILAGPLAFNLLMGRQWPPSAADVAEAETVCRELGLGDLLERMPSGIMQMVGETGWQLSQGERSRVFLARALLQRPELVLLDESFAALDPENLRQSLECVLRRAETLMVVAHP